MAELIPVLSGFLHKKGGLSWQKRWFVLSQAGTHPAKLEYFKDEHDKSKPKSLDLTSDTKVDLLPDKPFAFQVIIKGRALKVYADTEADRDGWLKALRDSIATAISQTLVHKFGQDWCIDPKYSLVKKLGSGAYGFVASAEDVTTKKMTAIKKVANAFEDMVDAKRILREIRLMRQLDHPCVVKLYDVMEPPYIDDFEDLYIVTELMSTDLHKILYSKSASLTTEQLQYLLYQMICGMHFVSTASILHRDLKPANLLVDVQTCSLQVCDFGLARGVAPTDENAMMDPEGNPVEPEEQTEYVVTRWYRAPEIMLGYHQYDKAIDMWSIGCIFGEMLLRNPLFAGSDYVDQLKRVVKVLGKPKEDALWFISNQNAMNFMQQLPDYPAVPLADVIPAPAGAEDAHCEPALDLLAKMLVFDPKGRISYTDAMAHPYVAEFRDERLEQPAGFSVEMADIENLKLTKGNLQRMMFEEVRSFHRAAQAAAGGGDEDVAMDSAR